MKQITVYGADWCPDCHSTRAWLDKQDIPYEYHDIEREGRSQLESVAPGVQSIPVVFVDKQMLIEPSIGALAAAVRAK